MNEEWKIGSENQNQQKFRDFKNTKQLTNYKKSNNQL